MKLELLPGCRLQKTALGQAWWYTTVIPAALARVKEGVLRVCTGTAAGSQTVLGNPKALSPAPVT